MDEDTLLAKLRELKQARLDGNIAESKAAALKAELLGEMQARGSVLFEGDDGRKHEAYFAPSDVTTVDIDALYDALTEAYGPEEAYKIMEEVAPRKIVVPEFERYAKTHRIAPDIVDKVTDTVPGSATIRFGAPQDHR